MEGLRPVLKPVVTALFAAVLLVSLPGASPAQDKPKKIKIPPIVEEHSKRVVRVEVKGKLTGAAFPVGERNLFLTAHGNVERAGGEIALILPGGERVAASVLKSDAPRGLDLLRSAKPADVDPLPIAKDLPDNGDNLFITSYAVGGKPTIRAELKLRGFANAPTNARYIEGRNGGPLLNDEGEVVAVSIPRKTGSEAELLPTVGLRQVPREIKTEEIAEAKDVPVVLIVVSIGGFLFLLNLFLQVLAKARVRREARASIAMAPTGAGGAAAAAPAPALDDLDISLKPKSR